MTHDTMEQRQDDGEPASRDRWRRLYAGVVACTALAILLLFLFSRHFSG